MRTGSPLCDAARCNNEDDVKRLIAANPELAQVGKSSFVLRLHFFVISFIVTFFFFLPPQVAQLWSGVEGGNTFCAAKSIHYLFVSHSTLAILLR